QPAFGPEGRIYYLEERQGASGGAAGGRGRGGGSVTTLQSIKVDGGDKRPHVSFPLADEAAPSPDGKWVAFQEGDEVYLAAFPAAGTTPATIEKRRTAGVQQISHAGGVFLRWRDATTLEYGSGNRHYTYHAEEGTLDSTVVHLKVPRPIPSGSVAF